MLRLQVVWTGVPGTPYVSTHHADGGLEDAQSLVDAVADFWGTVDDNIGTALSWSTEAEVLNIDPATGALLGVASVTPASGQGSSTGELLPLATQALLRLNTGGIQNGRRIGGRLFIPGLVESYSDGGVLNGQVAGFIEGAFEVWMSSTAVPPVVWSRAGGAQVGVTSVSCWEQFAVLRSRRD